MIASIIEMEVTMAKHGPEEGWRQHVLGMLPRMEATTEQPTSFTPATAADFGPVVFRGDRSPDDPAASLPDAAATKFIAIEQIASDLHGSIPTHEEISEVRLEATGLKNRLADLKRPLSEGGSPVPATAWQIADIERKLARCEKELTRLTELKEVRSIRWTSAARLRQSVSDWILRGIPGGCSVEPVADPSIAELLVKADGNRIEPAVERYRLRLREHDADAHRVRSAPFPASAAKAAAKEFIDRLADEAQPDLDRAIEHGLDIAFATKRLTSQVYNVVNSPGAIAYGEIDNVTGFLCWLFRDQVLAKINAGFDEIADDKSALSFAQREEMLATISADRLATERREVACIWAAAERGEIIDLRSDTTPMCAIGVSLRTLPRATELPPSSPERAGFDLIGGRR
jgi:hypothetical protein